MYRLLAERCCLVLFVSIFLTVFSLQGCATVTRGTTEALVVETNPPGAKVTVMKMDKIEYKIPESKELKDVVEDEQEVYGRYMYVVNPEFKKIEAATPTSFKLARRGQYKIIVEKDGYEVAKVMVHAQVTDAGSAGLAGNICLGGCIGAGVDAASGAMNKLVPNPIDIKLVALKEQREFATFEAKKFSIPKSEFSDEVYALVIGISQYKYVNQGGLVNLSYADDDARAIAKSLKELGWSDSRIRILINEEATKRNIEIALESWLSKAREGKLIVIFWSGHGYPDPEDPEKVYFACYDTIMNIPATGYRMDRVRSILEEHRARNVIVLADTCHAGKLITRGKRAISIVPHIEKMRREQSIPKGWIFMVGADSDRLAIENSSWTNGAFTHCLIEALSGQADGFESAGPKDGTVTMREVRAYLNSVMPDETQRILGVAKRPVITTSTGDPTIWDLSLDRR
jgi:hypothetical protein